MSIRSLSSRGICRGLFLWSFQIPSLPCPTSAVLPIPAHFLIENCTGVLQLPDTLRLSVPELEYCQTARGIQSFRQRWSPARQRPTIRQRVCRMHSLLSQRSHSPLEQKESIADEPATA